MSRTNKSQNSNLYVQLADRILYYIQQNQLKTGDRIPSERSMTDIFHTSRASVREAVRILESKGFIEVQIGNGMYVRDASDHPIELWKTDYQELLEAKVALENHLIRRLCTTATEEVVRYLEEPVLVMEQDYEKGIFLIEHDGVFHRRIREVSGNDTIARLIDGLLEKLNTYGYDMQGIQDIWRMTIPFHREILEGIRNHDAARAEEACRMIYEMDRQGLVAGARSKDPADEEEEIEPA